MINQPFTRFVLNSNSSLSSVCSICLYIPLYVQYTHTHTGHRVFLIFFLSLTKDAYEEVMNVLVK